MALETTQWTDALVPTSSDLYDSATDLYDTTGSYDGTITNNNATVWTAID